jgi:hypothetical protein
MRHTRKLLLLFSLLMFVASTICAQELPKFRDYRVTESYHGRTARLVLTRKDRAFASRLRAAARHDKPNFAGHYILTTWGCGAGCLMGAVIDAKTGKVYWWDFSICCWENTDENFKPIEARLDSTLLVFSGLRNEKEGDNGAHFYNFEGGRFVYLRTVRQRE